MKFIPKQSFKKDVVEISLAETDEGIEVIAENGNQYAILMVFTKGHFYRKKDVNVNGIIKNANGKIMEGKLDL